MWTVIYLASDRRKAEEVQQHLQKEGFLVMLRSANADEPFTMEVLVPETEAQEAQDFLTDLWISFGR
ncbi:MAG: glutamate decarboxylase [Clostridia bacterium]|nr:MAG: glutamate decarboxylase [Clostridia bacterium]